MYSRVTACCTCVCTGEGRSWCSHTILLTTHLQPAQAQSTVDVSCLCIVQHLQQDSVVVVGHRMGGYLVCMLNFLEFDSCIGGLVLVGVQNAGYMSESFLNICFSATPSDTKKLKIIWACLHSFIILNIELVGKGNIVISPLTI